MRTGIDQLSQCQRVRVRVRFKVRVRGRVTVRVMTRVAKMCFDWRRMLGLDLRSWLGLVCQSSGYLRQ